MLVFSLQKQMKDNLVLLALTIRLLYNSKSTLFEWLEIMNFIKPQKHLTEKSTLPYKQAL